MNTPTNDRARWERMNTDLRSESLCQPEDVKYLSQSTVCQSQLQSNFRLVSNILRYFVTIFFLFYDGSLDMSELIT